MKIRKAVIPAAGYGTRFLPATKSQPKEMLPIIDKPTIQYIVEEAVAAGIEEILIITNSQKTSIENHFDRSWELEYFLVRKGKTEELAQIQHISEIANIHTVRQKEQKGLGHAIYCAKAFVGNEPFAVLLGDDVVDNDAYPAIKQLVDQFEQLQSSIVGVQAVPYDDLNKYGIVELNGDMTNHLGKLIGMVEKPSPEVAPSKYGVLGRYVLTPKIFELLEHQAEGHGGEIQLTDAIQGLLAYEEVYAYEFQGKRYDVGSKIGYLEAIIDFSLKRDDLKDEFRALLLSKTKK
ncbi:MAG: UTP--glucose-1-phosphate uridylyltransferase GalU [Bacilli bacterium]